MMSINVMIIDMLDGVIRSGWKFKEGSVINEDALYASGFENIVINKDFNLTDVERHQQITIPQGLFQASDMMDRDHDSRHIQSLRPHNKDLELEPSSHRLIRLVWGLHVCWRIPDKLFRSDRCLRPHESHKSEIPA